MITIKKFSHEESIIEACALLYISYIEECQWKFSPNNPSLLRVEIKNNRKLLVDRFTYSAIWFGAFDGSKLIGCVRLCGADENNKFEVEGYPNSHVIGSYLTKNSLELTKAAVSSKYKGQRILNRLYLAAFEYCEANKTSIFGCANNPYVKSLLRRIEFPLKIEHAFKYESHDSMPVNFYYASYENGEIANMIKKSKIPHKGVDNDYDILEALDKISQILPAPVYWHDSKGVVLGANEHCLKGMGAANSNDIIGKTPYDFYPKETAEHILKHNEQVMRSGEILAQEECIEDITTGKVKYFSAIKSPLYDNEGMIIGIIGSSIETTSEKEAEKLKYENKIHIANLALQKVISEEQEKFRKIVKQMLHDITSPIASIDTITKRLSSNIPENDRVTLRHAVDRIAGISQKLLSQYENKNIIEDTDETLLVSLALLQIMNEKREEHQESGVTFEVKINALSYFTFIKLSSGIFKRMVSNLVNNAVDAVAGKPNPTVTVRLSSPSADKILILVRDNGSGMSEHVQDKFKQGIEVSDGKEFGHGIGLTQVKDAIQAGSGTCEIYATAESGTKIMIWFPNAETPHWLASTINLTKDDTVIILDDDSSIHGAWDSNFKNILEEVPTLQLKHFTHGKDVINYINSLTAKQKEDIFLLTDFELLEQGINGLEVIEQTGMSRAILVSSYATNSDIQAQVAKARIKLLPKELASAAKIVVDKKIQKGSKKVDMVWAEDQKWYVDSMVQRFYSHLAVDIYYNPDHLMEYIQQYPLDTRIILDTYYDAPDGTPYLTNGFTLAQELHAMGYTKLILFAGEEVNGRAPDYLTVILKGDTNWLHRLDQV